MRRTRVCGWRAVASGRMLPLVMFAVVACGALSIAAEDAAHSLGEFPAARLQTAAGDKLDLPSARGEAGTILVCMSVECPISNEFLPAIEEVAKRYAPRGIATIGINPNGGESLADMKEYACAHALSFPFARDEGGAVSRQLLFGVTPEVRVFDVQGRIVYRGRIDDRYRAGGGQPGAKIRHDLAEALEEMLAGKPVSQARTRTVGCPIQFAVPGK